MFRMFGGKVAPLLICLISAATFVLGEPHSSPAAPHITDFTLGMNREELARREVGVCDESFPHILCGNVIFGGKDWQGSFHVRDDALDSITLTAPLSDASLASAMQGFKESPYVLYMVLSDDMDFDFIMRAADGEDSRTLEASFKEFLGKLKQNPHEFVAYFYTDPATYNAAIKAAGEGKHVENGGVACCLTLGTDGVNIFISSWEQMHAVLHRYQDGEGDEQKTGNSK